MPALRTGADAAYLAYLQSPEWRARRNAALRRARWRCQRCGRAHRRDVPLEVHHRTYERLSAEWPTDLEVLCVDCHRGETAAAGSAALRLALKVARACLDAEPFTTTADLAEAVKVAASRRRLQLGPRTIDKAVGLVTAQCFRQPDVIDQVIAGIDAPEVIGPDEARQILERLGANAARQMPKARHISARERECHRALGIVMQAIADTTERCQELEAAPARSAGDDHADA